MAGELSPVTVNAQFINFLSIEVVDKGTKFIAVIAIPAIESTETMSRNSFFIVCPSSFANLYHNYDHDVSLSDLCCWIAKTVLENY